MRPNLINRLKEEWSNLDPIDPLRKLLSDAIDALAERPSGSATSAQLPFGVGGGLVAIKTLLSRDPCVHANTAIQMIDTMLAEQPAQRTWVGLTHEEHMEIMTGAMTTSSRMAAVEAKLKEKNT